MSDSPAPPRLQLRILFDGGDMFGPGKADLLDLVRQHGSIAAAGRKLGMSYKRAWTLVEAMNAMFAEPLVESSRGGAGHGGARVTPLGEEVLALYRSLAARTLAAPEFAAFERLRAAPKADMSDGK